MMENEAVLITGASSGLGKEFARLFAENGFDLVLVARDEQALDRLATQLTGRYGITATVITKDLSRHNAPQEIYDTLKSASIRVGIVVNNAGFLMYGPLQETDAADQLRVIQVNVVALTHLTMLFVRDMVARNRGRILNVGSAGAFVPVPSNAVYYASKAYVLSFSEAITRDLEGTGVSVTCLCPGAMRTEFARRAGIENVRLFRRFVMRPRQVARTGYRALMRGRTTVVPGLYNTLMMQSVRFAPRKAVTLLGRYLMSRSG